MIEHEEQLDVDGPNESVPSHEDMPESPEPGEGQEDEGGGGGEPSDSGPAFDPDQA